MNTVTKTESPRGSAPAAEPFAVPSVDITETKDEFVLQADMPGVTKDSLDVLLEGSELTIVGRRPSTKTGQYLHRESTAAAFRRTFVLDPMIDGTRVRAQIDNGVVCVHLPKAEEVKPRKVTVTD